MLKKILLVFIGLIITTQLDAQMNPVKFHRDSLANGLQIIYCPDTTAPVVATVVHYKVGSKDEVSTQTGYAHFFEHLMFESTKDIPRASIDKYVQEAGGNLNAHTSFDETVYYFKLPSNQLKLALWVEAQRMRNLNVNSDGVETQRGVVLEEIKERTTNQPYGTLLKKTMANLFPGTSYSWDVLGFEKNIAAASIDDFKNFYNKFYQPNNAVLVVAGDFNMGDTRELIREYFGQYKPGPKINRNTFDLKPLKKAHRETIHDNKVQLPGVFMSFRGPKKSDKDFYAVSLLTDILASGESSRLYKRLVDKEQIAVQASAMPLSLQHSGLLMLYGIASIGNDAEDVEEIILEEVNNVIKDGVTEKELEKAKNITESQFIFSKKNNLDIAESLAEYMSYYNDPELINEELEKYMDVTIDDIKHVAKKYFGTKRNVTLIYLPEEK